MPGKPLRTSLIVGLITLTLASWAGAVPAGVLFADDFEDGQLASEWTTAEDGDWREEDGILREVSNYYLYVSGFPQGTYALVGQAGWKDYTVSVDMMSTDDDGMGIIFNYKDELNGYLFVWIKEYGTRGLAKYVDGEEIWLAQEEVEYEEEVWYNISVETADGVIRCYVDGALVFDVTDTDFASGQAGLYCFGNRDSHFDNFSVTGTQAGEIVPSAVTSRSWGHIKADFMAP